MSDSTLTLLKQATEDIKKLRENHYSKAEIDERIGKYAKDLEEVQKAMREDIRRPSQGDPLVGGKMLAELGATSVKDVRDVEVYRKSLRGEVMPQRSVSEDVVAAVELIDKMFIVDTLLSHKHGGKGQFATLKAMKGGSRAWYEERAKESNGSFKSLFRRYDKLTQDLQQVTGKALSSTGSTAGDEWVPTGFGSNLLEQVRVATPTVNLFPVLPMPTNPFINPVMSTPGQCRIRTENTPVSEGTMATANKTWTASTFANYQAFSDELNEDSAVAVAAQVQADIVRVLAEGLEHAIVNGDADGASHIDDDYATGVLGAGFPQNASFNGLRQMFLDGGVGLSKNGGGLYMTAALFADALGSMGKFAAHKTNECAGLTNTETYLKLLTEANSPLVTVDKYGPGATILTGELGRIFGVPVFTAFGIEARRNLVAVTGMNDATGNTFSTGLIVNRMNFRLGDRRDVRLETDKDITAGKNQLVATARWAFQAVETPSATVPAGWAFINID